MFLVFRTNCCAVDPSPPEARHAYFSDRKSSFSSFFSILVLVTGRVFVAFEPLCYNLLPKGIRPERLRGSLVKSLQGFQQVCGSVRHMTATHLSLSADAARLSANARSSSSGQAYRSAGTASSSFSSAIVGSSPAVAFSSSSRRSSCSPEVSYQTESTRIHSRIWSFARGIIVR